MKDRYGRQIDYLRLSLTDRCNLRCRYCMPDGTELVSHGEILRYEELLAIVAAAVGLGITRFKITGGEPLVRSGALEFIQSVKGLPGVEQVTLTTNGILLPQYLDALCRIGVDGVNISLDTLDDALYSRLTGAPEGTGRAVQETIRLCALSGIPTKVNAVLLPENLEESADLAALAAPAPSVDVRLIERMPLGVEDDQPWVPLDRALERLKAAFPDLAPTGERRGNGPAVYYGSKRLAGRVGLIAAMSHAFCGNCNRVRLTSTGQLKPCLCYEAHTDLRGLLREGGRERLTEALRQAVLRKPPAHCFGAGTTERRTMNQIGG